MHRRRWAANRAPEESVRFPQRTQNPQQTSAKSVAPTSSSFLERVVFHNRMLISCCSSSACTCYKESSYTRKARNASRLQLDLPTHVASVNGEHRLWREVGRRHHSELQRNSSPYREMDQPSLKILLPPWQAQFPGIAAKL